MTNRRERVPRAELLLAIASRRYSLLGDCIHTAVAIHNAGLALHHAGSLKDSSHCFQYSISMLTRVSKNATCDELIGQAYVNLANYQVDLDGSGMSSMSTLVLALKIFQASRGDDDVYCAFLTKAINTLSIFS